MIKSAWFYQKKWYQNTALHRNIEKKLRLRYDEITKLYLHTVKPIFAFSTIRFYPDFS